MVQLLPTSVKLWRSVLMQFNPVIRLNKCAHRVNLRDGENPYNSPTNGKRETGILYNLPNDEHKKEKPEF